MCLGCKTCSAMMSPGDKYTVKVTDEQMNGYKETFMMFDKVRIAFLNQGKATAPIIIQFSSNLPGNCNKIHNINKQNRSPNLT